MRKNQIELENMIEYKLNKKGKFSKSNSSRRTACINKLGESKKSGRMGKFVHFEKFIRIQNWFK